MPKFKLKINYTGFSDLNLYNFTSEIINGLTNHPTFPQLKKQVEKLTLLHTSFKGVKSGSRQDLIRINEKNLIKTEICDLLRDISIEINALDIECSKLLESTGFIVPNTFKNNVIILPKLIRVGDFLNNTVKLTVVGGENILNYKYLYSLNAKDFISFSSKNKKHIFKDIPTNQPVYFKIIYQGADGNFYESETISKNIENL